MWLSRAFLLARESRRGRRRGRSVRSDLLHQRSLRFGRYELTKFFLKFLSLGDFLPLR